MSGLKVSLLHDVRSQRIYGVNNNVRRSYRSLRGNGISARDARLMVIGACVTLHCSLCESEHALRSGEWTLSAKPDRSGSPRA